MVIPPRVRLCWLLKPRMVIILWASNPISFWYVLTSLLGHSIIWHLDYAPHFPTHFPSTKLSNVKITSILHLQNVFLGPIGHTIEVTILHKWRHPYVIQGSFVISTLEYAREPHETLHDHWGTLENVGSIILQYKCSFILMWLLYVYKLTSYVK